VSKKGAIGPSAAPSCKRYSSHGLSVSEGFKLDIYIIIISVILVNAVIFIVIGMLKERIHYQRVSWTCFFFVISYHVSLLVSEFIYLKIAQIFNSFNLNDPS
jgi:hypothetical protein